MIANKTLVQEYYIKESMSSITIDKRGAVFTLRLVGVLLFLAFMYQGWQFVANDYFGDEQFAMIPEALGVLKSEPKEDPNKHYFKTAKSTTSVTSC